MNGPRARLPRSPLVSVCIPTYNHGRYLGRCLRSILAQTYDRLEVIVSDNASTDDTPGIVAALADPRLRYSRTDENIGGFPNWNRCLGMASGDFVAIYHSDDLYEPEIVAEEVRFLLEHEEAGAVFTRAWVMDEEERTLEEMAAPSPLRGIEVFAFADALRAMIEHGNFLVCPTFMARNEVLRRTAGFEPERFGSAADTGMWLGILTLAPVGIVDRPLMRYRVGKQQGTYSIENLRVARADHFRAIDHFLAHPLAAGAVPPTLLRKHETGKIVDEMRCLRNLIARGRIEEALAMSRRIYTLNVAREYLRGGRRLRYLAKRVFYSLMLEAGLGRITGKVLSHGGSVR